MTRLLPGPRLYKRGIRADRLTDRETQLVLLAAQGFSYLEMGQQLGLAPKTVRNYFRDVLRKLGVRNRTEAVVLLWRRGVVPNREHGPHCVLDQERLRRDCNAPVC